jgi:hypothetical protein
MATHKISATDQVVAINPATSKPSIMTRKAYDGVYRERGFELVDRDNADEATAGRTQPGNIRNVKTNAVQDRNADEGVATGGAAAIAAGLSLDNEKSVDNTSEDSDGREANKRDRGGRK